MGDLFLIWPQRPAVGHDEASDKKIYPNLPHGWQGHMRFDHFWLLFPDSLQGDGLEIEQLRTELHPI